MKEIQQFFASCPKGLEILLKQELSGLGAVECRETIAGVYFSSDIESAYRCCLWSRLANRILKPVSEFFVDQPQDLLKGVTNISWDQYFSSDKTFIVDFTGVNDSIRHTQYGAQTVKDGVVDFFREFDGSRPSVSKDAPDVRINARLAKNKVHISLDYSGESLHKRGYRKGQGGAPLKENLAAAILLRSGWSTMLASAKPLPIEPEATEASVPLNLGLIDPMCGSGTLLIEGALIAAGIAPGLTRMRFGFEKLKSFQSDLWSGLLAEAREAKKTGLAKPLPEFRGYDISHKVLDAAQDCIDAAGLNGIVRVLQKPAEDFKKPTHRKIDTGLFVCNPPYGERLGEVEALRDTYRQLGVVAKQELAGWSMGVFTGNVELGRELRLRPKKKYKLFNGTIPSELLLYDLLGDEAKLRVDPGADGGADEEVKQTPLSDGAVMVANRIKKNKKRLASWIKSEGVEAYRLYDADLPEYSAAVDVYGQFIHIQEYQAPQSVDAAKAEKRFADLVRAVAHVFDIPFREIETRIVTKTRRKNRGKSQYEKVGLEKAEDYFSVSESGAKLLVNLRDYLDTGVFLDHRPLRNRIAEEVRGKTFLNLFCYTATATVRAALGGASSSISVDMSNTYLEWAKKNFDLNGVKSHKHLLVREDCFSWIKQCRQGFDVIMLDPPTFSNSKKMADVLDIQRDHVGLIKRCVELLTPGGTLYFSTNFQRFKLDSEALESFDIDDISLSTLDPDFKQRPKIHYCWMIREKRS